MNRLQKISTRLARKDRPKRSARRRRTTRLGPGSWRWLMEKLARHPDRYLF